MLRGSYYNGFAPRDGMPLYPSLWQGCVGAWAPCLGPTGLQIRDWAPYRITGTATNTATTFWGISGGRHALLFDGTDDYVSLGINSPLNITSKLTICAWVNTTASAVQYPFASGLGSGFTGYALGINIGAGGSSGSGKLGFWNGASWFGTSSSSGVNDGTWRLLTVMNDGSSTYLYLGTTLVTSGAHSAPTSNTTAEQRIGCRESLTGPFNGYIGEIRVYNRVLQVKELSVLYQRLGIAYDLAPMRVPYSEQGVSGAARLRRILLGME